MPSPARAHRRPTCATLSAMDTKLPTHAPAAAVALTWRGLRPGVALFLFLFGWLLLLSSGHTYTSDEETMLAVAQSLVARGSFALEPDFLMNYGAGGTDGQRYSRYGPGQSVLLVPFVVLGETLAATGPDFARSFIVRLWVALLPALVTAATGAVLYAWVRAMGYRVRIALAIGLLYGTTSLAMPYSRTLFAEPTATLFLVLGGYGIRRATWPWWLVAGAAAAAALAVKVQVALALPVLAVYALLVSWQGVSAATLRAVLGRGIAGVAGAMPLIGLYLLYNNALFGNPFTSGYGSLDPTAELGVAWYEGLHGLLTSSGKGLLIFSPVVLLGLVGIPMQWRQQWRESVLAVLMLLIHLAFYMRLNYWHGDGSWGPRYMVFVVPFLMLPAAGLLAWLATQRKPALNVLAGTVVILSLAVQLLPILANMNTYMQLSDQYTRFFTPAASPIVGHWQLFNARLEAWLVRYLPPTNTAVLRDGFSYSEGDRKQGELLPRWTYGDAEVWLYPDPTRPLDGRIVVGDHRPWPLERAQFELLLDGQPLASVQRTDLTGEQIMWELAFTLPPEYLHTGTRLTLHSDTWNPTRATTDNPRNEDLGLLLEHLSLTQGDTTLTLREALPIPSVKRGRRDLWLWYYDTPNQHLLDHWLWYITVTGMPTAPMLLHIALYGGLGLAALGLGGRGVWRAWHADTTPPPPVEAAL